jgi:hypothetical protein
MPTLSLLKTHSEPFQTAISSKRWETVYSLHKGTSYIIVIKNIIVIFVVITIQNIR